MKRRGLIIISIITLALLISIPIVYAVWQVIVSNRDDVDKDTYTLQVVTRSGTTTYSDLEYNATVKLEEQPNDGIYFFKGWSSDSNGVSPAPTKTYDFVVKDEASGSTTSFTMYAIYTTDVPSGYVRIDLYERGQVNSYASHFIKASGKFRLFNLATDPSDAILSFTGESALYCANDNDVYNNYLDLGCNYYLDFSKNQLLTQLTSMNNIIKLTVSSFSYTIEFVANSSNGDITGSMSSLDMTYGVSNTLTTNAFVRDGYTFVSWNTSPDGSGTTYSNGASVNNLTKIIGDVVYLYAQWEPNA